MVGPWDRVLMGFKAPKPPSDYPKDPAKVVAEKPKEPKAARARKAPQAKT